MPILTATGYHYQSTYQCTIRHSLCPKNGLWSIIHNPLIIPVRPLNFFMYLYIEREIGTAATKTPYRVIQNGFADGPQLIRKQLCLDACKKIKGVQELLLIMPDHDPTPLSREFLSVALLTIQSKCNIETPTVHEPYPYFHKKLSCLSDKAHA